MESAAYSEQGRGIRWKDMIAKCDKMIMCGPFPQLGHDNRVERRAFCWPAW